MSLAILNFVPLLIWSMGFPLVAKKVNFDDESGAYLYLIGCIGWMGIGCVLTFR